MKLFTRQTSLKVKSGPLEINFRAASDKLPEVFDPNVYNLTIKSARTVQNNNGNLLVALELVENDSGKSVEIQPIWIDGPNASNGHLAARNQELIADLLELAGQETQGDINLLIASLVGLSFNGRLALTVNSRTGRTFNELVDAKPLGVS